MTYLISYNKHESLKTLYLPCGCSTEILALEYDKTYQIADFAIYTHGVFSCGKMSIWQKLRYCWRVLWLGKPFGDAMVLENDQLIVLRDFLNELNLHSN